MCQAHSTQRPWRAWDPVQCWTTASRTALQLPCMTVRSWQCSAVASHGHGAAQSLPWSAAGACISVHAHPPCPPPQHGLHPVGEHLTVKPSPLLETTQGINTRPFYISQDPYKTPIQVPQATLPPVLKDSFLAPGGSANFLLSSGCKGPPDPHRWQSPESSPFHSSSSLFSYYIFILRISLTRVDVTCFMAQIENQIRNHSSYLRTYSCLWGNDSWGKQG